jgi:hypothetical protein
VDFIQADPLEGQPASEHTEVRIAYDADYLYIGAMMHDSDPDGIVVNELRKDFAGRDQDTFEVLLDTFSDRRNGFVFTTNSAGAKADTQMANEGRDVNPNWDAVWWVQSRRTDGGWSAEFRIPFKTLRFDAGDTQTWGINFARRVRRKSEISYWSPVSRAYTIYRASSEGDLAGLPSLKQGRNLRIKPFRSLSTPPSILTSRRPKPTSSKSTSRSSACSSRKNASSSSRTRASSTLATSRAISAHRAASVRQRKTCCCSSAAASD